MWRDFGGTGRTFARFIEDRSGNFAVITAATITTILLSIGFGINTAQMVLTRSNLLNALDSAVTSTARDLTTGVIPEDDAEKTVKAFLFTNGGTGFASADKISLDSLVDNAMGSCKRTNSLEDRADIAASRVRADIASRGVDDAWLQFSPTITAGSGINETFIDPGSPNPTWNIQAVLSVPIWDGGARYGALRSARVDEDEAKQNLTALRRNAQIQLVQAQRGVQVAESSRKVASDNRALAAETDRLTQVGYMSGQGTSLELVTAASALRDAEINLALKDFSVVQARVAALLQLANCPW